MSWINEGGGEIFRRVQCVQGNSRKDRCMAQPDFMDFLIWDELISDPESFPATSILLSAGR